MTSPVPPSAYPSSGPFADDTRSRAVALRFFVYLFVMELFVAVVPAMEAMGQGGLALPLLFTFSLYTGAGFLARSAVGFLPVPMRGIKVVSLLLVLLASAVGVWAGRAIPGALGVPPLAMGMSLLGTRMTTGRPSRLRFALRTLLVVGLLAALIPCLRPLRADEDPASLRAPPGSPNLLLVVLDTVRWDALSYEGKVKGTTPGVDSLVAGGVRFTHGYSNAMWTLPGHASLFTGLYPSVHGAHHENWNLTDTHPTLATLLRRAGWETTVFTGNPLLSSGTGLVKGFSLVHPSWRPSVFQTCFVMRLALAKASGKERDKGAQESARAFDRWLKGRKEPQRPFFAAVNLMDAHAPYHQVPEELSKRFLAPDVTSLRASKVSLGIFTQPLLGLPLPTDPRRDEIARSLYYAGVATADAAVSQIIRSLQEHDAFGNTLVVVTSDHGELLGEHGTYGHGFSTYDEVIRIPYLIHWPAKVAKDKVFSNPIQQVDLLPTVLGLLGRVDLIPPDLPGRNFSGALQSGVEMEEVPVIAEHFTPFLPNPRVSGDVMKGDLPYLLARRRSVTYRNWKYSVDSKGLETLFDLTADPGEVTNRIRESPEKAEPLRASLKDWIDTGKGKAWDGREASPQEGNPNRLGPAAKERLRALGYIQ